MLFPVTSRSQPGLASQRVQIRGKNHMDDLFLNDQGTVKSPPVCFYSHFVKVNEFEPLSHRRNYYNWNARFEGNHYVVGTERKQLANRLALSETQTKRLGTTVSCEMYRI
ncbi:hypothetical protein OSTOST_11059 [Ostertagia ostertagi]